MMSPKDRSAWPVEDRNRLLEAELPALRRYARALARDAEAANDLVQETAMRAVARWDQWRREAPLKAWLFAIMRNAFLQSARSAARWRTVSADLTHTATDGAAPAAVDPLFLRDLGAALAELTQTQREILFLVAVEGLSYAEVAALTETPIGTVMSRLSRARAQLRARTDGL